MRPRASAEPPEGGDRDLLQADLRRLERRLRDGEEKVRNAKDQGDWSSADRWETAWIGLLHQYETVVDRLFASSDASLHKGTGESSA
jgi:hypothetical protein